MGHWLLTMFSLNNSKCNVKKPKNLNSTFLIVFISKTVLTPLIKLSL